MPSPGLTSSELHFPSTHSSLDVLKESCSQSLLLPFLALFPSTPPPHSPGTVFSALTPQPQFQRPLCPMSWGMEFPGHFSSSLVISCQVPPPPLSLHPALARSLEKEQKQPCSLHGPFLCLSFPLPSHPSFLSTQL